MARTKIYIGGGGASGTPGGANTNVQYNDSGVLGGDSGLTYNKSTQTLTVGSGGGSVALAGATSGTITVVPVATAGSNTITLPAQTYTLSNIMTCMIVVGAENGTALVDADLGPQNEGCQIPVAATVFEVDVTADSTTAPSIIVRKKAGNGTTYTNLISGALATSGSANNNFACASTASACIQGATKSGSITIVTAGSANVLAAGDFIGLTSGTANSAKRVSVAIHMTRN